MCANRLFPCPPWPADGYHDWPPTAALLRDEFGARADWLEADLFREAFSGAAAGVGASDADRADLTKNMSVALILDHNRRLVNSMVRGAGLSSGQGLYDVAVAAWVRAVSEEAPVTVHERLCEWHDANQETDLGARHRLRARCIRSIARHSARAERRNQFTTLDEEALGVLLDRISYLAWDRRAETDAEHMRQAVATVLGRYNSDEQFIFMKHYADQWTLQAVRDELERRGRRMSLATVFNRATEVLRAVRDEFKG